MKRSRAVLIGCASENDILQGVVVLSWAIVLGS